MGAARSDLRSGAAADGLCRLAEEAARTGGTVARGYFRGPLAVRLKADRSEVSEADEAAQAAVIARLRMHCPADGFIAEETLTHGGAATPANDAVCWVIDPIDGTRNFVRGIPTYACSVAAMYRGEPIAGAIYDAERDTLYSAGRGGPLLVNGRPLDSVADAVAPRGRPIVGIPSTPAGPLATLAHQWLEAYVCRNFGSTALHLAMVATGELDGMFADNPRLWDIAAGYILVTAAGGRVLRPTGQPLFPLDVQRYRGEELPLIAERASAVGRLFGLAAL